MSKVGFIGLGIMGTPMAGNIRGGGHDLYVYDIKPVPKSLSDKGAVACGSAKEVAEKAEIIITTQKDAVRFPKIDRRDLPFYFMRVEIKILRGAKPSELPVQMAVKYLLIINLKTAKASESVRT